MPIRAVPSAFSCMPQPINDWARPFYFEKLGGQNAPTQQPSRIERSTGVLRTSDNPMVSEFRLFLFVHVLFLSLFSFVSPMSSFHILKVTLRFHYPMTKLRRTSNTFDIRGTMTLRTMAAAAVGGPGRPGRATVHTETVPRRVSGVGRGALLRGDGKTNLL